MILLALFYTIKQVILALPNIETVYINDEGIYHSYLAAS